MRIIDPILMQKINKKNQTIYNNANPKMSVQVSRAKDTVMDSSYWTVETIRTKEGLGDLSIAARRQRPYGRPDRLFNIYVDNGIVKTAIREYPDYLKEKWKNKFDIGPGTAVAIAFDGHWELYRKKWQMVTSEKPWIFWVSSGKLWAQIWDEESTRLQLATGVTKVKAIRGWKNLNILEEVDQGLIVGYIKEDGKVYYRNYCYQAGGSFVWELERQIPEFPGASTNLNMFITNDYRLGFIVEDSIGSIRWAITTRSWAGMAIAPEKLYANMSATIDFIPLEFIDVVIPNEHLTTDVSATTYLCPINKLDVEPISINRPNVTQLAITFNTDLFNVSKNGFAVTNESGSISYTVSTVMFNSGTKELLITLSSAMDANSNVKVNYSSGSILVVDDDYCKLELNPFEIINEGLPQDGYEKEYLMANVTAEITMTKLVFSEGFVPNEYLAASITATIQFWTVDDAPI